MAFFNDAIQDDNVCIVLEETKTPEYPKLGLACKYPQALYKQCMFQTVNQN